MTGHERAGAESSSLDVAERVKAARDFRVGYKDTVTGPPRVIDLSQADLVDFCWPIRRPAAYKGQWSKPGYYYMASIDDLATYESRYEMSHLALQDQRHCVASVCPQPFRLYWRLGNGRRTHVPDFFFRLRDGSTEVFDVKGSRFASEPENAYVFGVTARACELMGHTYRVAHDLTDPLRDNVDWINGARNRPALADIIEADVGHEAGSGVPLGDLIDLIATRHGRHPTQVRGVVFHLIWSGSLKIDWHEPLSSRSLVGRSALENTRHA